MVQIPNFDDHGKWQLWLWRQIFRKEQIFVQWKLPQSEPTWGFSFYQTLIAYVAAEVAPVDDIGSGFNPPWADGHNILGQAHFGE